MKRYILMIVLIVAMVLIVVTTFICINKRFNDLELVDNGISTDGFFCNLNGSNLLCGRDALYYCYSPQDDSVSAYSGIMTKDGIYKIHDYGSDKISNSSEMARHSYYMYNNKLVEAGSFGYGEDDYDGMSNDYVLCFDETKNKYEHIKPEKMEENRYIDFAVIAENFYYWSKKSLYISQDGIHVNMIFDDMDDVYYHNYDYAFAIDKESVLYFSRDLRRIKEYNIKEKRIITEYDVPETIFQRLEGKNDVDYDVGVNLYKCDKKIFFVLELGNEFNVFCVSDDFVSMYKSESYDANFSISYNDSLLFVASNNDGIKRINTDNYDIVNISDDPAEEIYIFYEKWVYYVDNHYNLVRIDYSGKERENVFLIDK